MPLTDADLREERESLFQLARLAFERAERSAGGCSFCARLGGRTVLLKSAGAFFLEQLRPALAHRACPPEAADLTVMLWDDQSSETPLPRLLASFLKHVEEWAWRSLDPRHELKRFNDERFCAVYRLGPDQVNILSLYDRQASQAFYWMRDASQLPYWERTSPLHMILNWWAESRDLQYVHAAAVGSPAGAVLLAGPGGSGKSSTALACLGSPLGYLADDYCLVAHDPARVYSLYATAKLIGEEDFQRFPQLRDWVENPLRGAEDKAVLNVHRHVPEQLLESAPIRAVIVPRVVPGSPHSRLEPLSGAKALLALAPSTMFQLAGTNQECLSRIARLLRQVPCYALNLGSDVAQIPALLGALCDG